MVANRFTEGDSVKVVGVDPQRFPGLPKCNKTFKEGYSGRKGKVQRILNDHAIMVGFGEDSGVFYPSELEKLEEGVLV